MSKNKVNEGLFSAADRFVSAFFKGLEKKTADRVIRQAEKAKLPPHAVELMKDIEKRSKELDDIVKKLSK